MLLKTGIIGVGNAGNMICALANTTKKISVLGLNSSERDLDAVKSSTAIDCFYIGSGDGAGKDRAVSKEALKGSIKDFMGKEQFQKLMKDCDVIFIVSSTGGGTGSGTCPMLADVLRNFYKDKLFVLVGILPTIGESIGAQRNTIEYISEDAKLNLPYMLFDNGNSGCKSTNATFEKINNDVVEAISIIRGDYNKLSPYGMIDRGDMEKMITLPGLIHINMLKGIYQEQIDTDGSIEDLILESIKKNTMVTIDRDKVVRRRAYIVNLSEDLQDYFDKDLPKITERYGEPIEVFDHYAVNDDDEEANYCIIMQSGLSLPENRLKAIKHRIDAAEEALKKQKESSILDSLSEKVSEFSDTSKNLTKSTTDFNLDDILGKY